MIDTKKLISQINVPQQDLVAYQKTCIAGMKLMFSPQSHQLMLDELKKNLPLDKKLAEGIGSLMVIMYKKSNGTMQPQAVIPSAMYLLFQAIDYLQKTGVDVSNQILASAIKQLTTAILSVFGGYSPAQQQQAFSGGK